MSKWTQEQRDKAGLEVETAYLAMPPTDGWPAERVKSVAVELACQRNELLEALKEACDIMQREIPWNAEKEFRSLIAKAEGK